MKKQENKTFDPEIKMIGRRFKKVDKQRIKLIYELAEYDELRTNKILTILTEKKNSQYIYEQLCNKPMKSEELLQELEDEYDKIYGIKDNQETVQQENQLQKVDLQKLDYNYFQQIPDDITVKIMSFLDPYSWNHFGITCSSMYKMMESQAQHEYFKTICVKLFSLQLSPLPFICRFEETRAYVLDRPQDYGPNTRHAIATNLRNYIWQMNLSSLKIEKNYYLKFGSYRNMFMNCPKVNLNGYYLCRHKYIKIGQKNMTIELTPIIIIYYYRYLRFLEDGSVIYYVCNRKLKQSQIIEVLSVSRLEEVFQGKLVGEYVQHKEKLYSKIAKNNEIFGYEMEIESNEKGVNNELKVMKYSLDLIDYHSFMHQDFFTAHPHKESLYFSYHHHQPIRQENSGRVQANWL